MNTLEAVRSAARQTDPWSGTAWRTLSTLCRKIDVGKRVCVHYDDDWSLPTAPESIDAEGWHELVQLLLVAVDQDHGGQAGALGRRLKLLNSLYKAIDLWNTIDAGEPGTAQAMRSRCDALRVRLIHD